MDYDEVVVYVHQYVQMFLKWMMTERQLLKLIQFQLGMKMMQKMQNQAVQ